MEEGIRRISNSNGRSSSAPHTSSSDSSMTNAHRILLQVFMMKHVILASELDVIYEKITKEYNREKIPIDDFIGTINNSLRLVFLEIRKGAAEEDGKIYWILVNTRNDDKTQLASQFTEKEMEFFKSLLQAFIAPKDEIAAENGVLDISIAAELVEGLFPKTHVGPLLQKLVEGKWLYMDEEKETISLGVRSLLELKPYFEESFEGYLHECLLCHEYVFKGQKCSNNSCTAKMHNYCVVKWFANRQDRKCPQCTSHWP